VLVRPRRARVRKQEVLKNKAIHLVIIFVAAKDVFAIPLVYIREYCREFMNNFRRARMKSSPFLRSRWRFATFRVCFFASVVCLSNA